MACCVLDGPKLISSMPFHFYKGSLTLSVSVCSCCPMQGEAKAWSSKQKLDNSCFVLAHSNKASESISLSQNGATYE